jgi:uncharacterized ferritin-like protein (DUF455 family)
MLNGPRSLLPMCFFTNLSKVLRGSIFLCLRHIEFNAINLALDAVYRFQDMPKQFYQDWIKVESWLIF